MELLSFFNFYSECWLFGPLQLDLPPLEQTSNYATGHVISTYCRSSISSVLPSGGPADSFIELYQKGTNIWFAISLCQYMIRHTISTYYPSSMFSVLRSGGRTNWVPELYQKGRNIWFGCNFWFIWSKWPFLISKDNKGLTFFETFSGTVESSVS